MHNVALLLVFSLLVLNIHAQEKVLPNEARPFIPGGYEMLDYVTGDLNNDKRTDAILIVKKPGEDSVREEWKRPLIVLIRQPNGSLKQVMQNDNAVLCYTCGGAFGDPYEGIIIKPGRMELSFYGGSSWRWTSTYSFTYNAIRKNWYLLNEHHSSFHAGDPETTHTEHTIPNTELGEIELSSFTSQPLYEDSRWTVKATRTYFYDSPRLNSKPRKGYLVKGNVFEGIRHLKNFIHGSFDDGKGNITQGFLLRRDLLQVKK